VSTYPDAPCPSEDFGLPPDRGFASVNIEPRHHPGDCLSLVLCLYEPPSHESDRTVVLELRDLGGEVVDRAAGAVGRLTERTLWFSVQLPRRAPAGYVARLQIHQPDAPPRVFEWPVEVPDPTLPLSASLSLSAATAAPGDTLELTAHNTGPAWLALGEQYYLQRWPDSTGWKDVRRGDGDLMHLIELPPGSSHTRWVVVPRRAGPGRHRIIKEFGSRWAHGNVRASVEFDVVAPASH
jgi:hypothetical protein